MKAPDLLSDYYRVRDFEYVQPLYDLAFLLEVDALAKRQEIPKYRTFSLWRAGYSLDGYGTTIDRWLEGKAGNQDLDYVPSTRIRQYLTSIRLSGTVPELGQYKTVGHDRCLRLRSVRGLGPAAIALTLLSTAIDEHFLGNVKNVFAANRDRIASIWAGTSVGPWQSAHIVPPLMRFLHRIQTCSGKTLRATIAGIHDPFEPINSPISVDVNLDSELLPAAVQAALSVENQFHTANSQTSGRIRIEHQMGWGFELKSSGKRIGRDTIAAIIASLDPMANCENHGLQSDLHLHTAWSDGSASVNTMAIAVVDSGLNFFAVTDHSRSEKLQGGLTPPLWLRQANALTLAKPVCPVLHGIEVDILKDGSLDLPKSLLRAADIVVASVHSNWADDPRTNTDRLLKAIQSGCIDVMAHPTSAVIGKPGVPDYWRPPAEVYWDEVFRECSRWRVALELNCFPSRLDLSLGMLQKAITAGCTISIGSDAHARSHLLNLRFGAAALLRLEAHTVLNRLSYDHLKQWIAESRGIRSEMSASLFGARQSELFFEALAGPTKPQLQARIRPPQNIPSGSRVVGIDLTAGDKATGIALLDGFDVQTCSLTTDEEILRFVAEKSPQIVSIDSPLGLPGGGITIDPAAGIVRVAERDLASVGIPAYPALIDSMKSLTLRGIGLRRAIQQLPLAPHVIESYPGAAQDILSIPRKQKGLDLLREGLRRLGLTGSGLDTASHDEMDAITSAIVGRYFESGQFEPMGIPSEAQLVVPKVRPLQFELSPIICLAGMTGAGKSVVARYLSVFYGFDWIRTRGLIRDLLIEDLEVPLSDRLFQRRVNADAITEQDLRDFGAVILNEYQQIPLRRKLSNTINGLSQPVVVDSVRDLADVDLDQVGNRPVMIWYIDCNDATRQQRISTKSKLGAKRPSGISSVDRMAPLLRERATNVIPNNGSLEELRWRVDDTLLDAIYIYPPTPTS